MSWVDFLKDSERQRLEELKAVDEQTRQERRRIYQRAWKRAKSAGVNEEGRS